MSRTGIVIKRNVRLFFRDKGMFFTSLITPAILLVLYATFLAGVYRDSFTAALPPALQLPEDLVDGLDAGSIQVTVDLSGARLGDELQRFAARVSLTGEQQEGLGILGTHYSTALRLTPQ